MMLEPALENSDDESGYWPVQDGGVFESRWTRQVSFCSDETWTLTHLRLYSRFQQNSSTISMIKIRGQIWPTRSETSAALHGQ